ncbi:MAG: hypothetical protein ACI4MZ_03505 [Christensenellales bacterium]
MRKSKSSRTYLVASCALDITCSSVYLVLSAISLVLAIVMFASQPSETASGASVAFGRAFGVIFLVAFEVAFAFSLLSLLSLVISCKSVRRSNGLKNPQQSLTVASVFNFLAVAVFLLAPAITASELDKNSYYVFILFAFIVIARVAGGALKLQAVKLLRLENTKVDEENTSSDEQ